MGVRLAVPISPFSYVRILDPLDQFLPYFFRQINPLRRYGKRSALWAEVLQVCSRGEILGR
jgi:hypothetical protein